MKRFNLDGTGFYLTATIIWGVLCWLNLAAAVGRPFPGFLTYHSFFGHKINVARYTPAWWWGISEQDVAIDDTLAIIEGVPFEGITQMVNEPAIYEQARAAGQTNVTVEIRRNGQPLTLHPPLIPFSWRHVIDLTLSPIIAATCLWLLALLLYQAAAGTMAQKLTIILLAQLALLLLGNRISLFEYQWQHQILNTGVQLTATTTGIILVHLSYYFPFERPSWYKPWSSLWRLLYAFLAFLSLIFILTHIHLWQKGFSPFTDTADKLWFYSYTILGILGVVVFGLRLSGEWLAAQQNPRVRRETSILLASILVASPAFWLALNGGNIQSQFLKVMAQLADLRFFALALPFAFAAITLRYHTFPGATQWLLFVLLLALSGLGANAGAIVLFQQSPELARSLAVPPTLIFFVLLLIFSLVWGLQSQWWGWLGRLFHWQRIGYHAIQQIGQTLVSRPYHNQQHLAQNMAQVLCQALVLEQSSFWLKEGDGFQLQAVHGQWSNSMPAWLKPPPNLGLSFIRVKPEEIGWLRPLSPHIVLLIPLGIEGKLLGFMGLGKRWDTADFDERDLETVQLMGQQATLFLYNAQQSDQLRMADRQLLQIQENTRRQLAQDLHDYVLPTFGRLSLRLQTGANYLLTEPHQTQHILQQSQTELQTLTQKIRHIQQALILRPLEYGLTAYLLEITQQFQADCHTVVHITLPSDLDDVITDLKVRQVIYAVCQQAFDNIQLHAKASAVIFKIWYAPHQVCLLVQDNGLGCTLAQREMARQNGRFGLKSMEIRLESVGGTFQFDSAPGQGTTIRACLNQASATPVGPVAGNLSGDTHPAPSG